MYQALSYHFRSIVLLCPFFRWGKERHTEVRETDQDHTAIKQEKWVSNPGGLALQSMLLTLRSAYTARVLSLWQCISPVSSTPFVYFSIWHLSINVINHIKPSLCIFFQTMLLRNHGLICATLSNFGCIYTTDMLSMILDVREITRKIWTSRHTNKHPHIRWCGKCYNKIKFHYQVN